MSIQDWTYSLTESPPRTITINYQTQSGVKQSVDLQSTDISETVTTYITATYTDEQGKPQQTDVTIEKLETKRTTQASVAGSMVANKLSLGLGLPSGDALTVTRTTYDYITSTTGPILVRERSETSISTVELAGSLAVPTYQYYTPGTDVFISTVTEIIYETATGSDNREYTRQLTSRWNAYGQTQDGQQAFAEQMKQTSAIATDEALSSSYLTASVNTMKVLVFEGTEVSLNIGRAQIPFKPSDEELLREEVLNESENDDNENEPYSSLKNGGLSRIELGSNRNGDGVVEGAVLFQDTPYDNTQSTVTAVYSMPYAPDDIFEYIDGVRTLVPGNAAEAAAKFGLTESLLEISHAFGQNIVTGWNEVPSLALSTVYIRLAGVEGCFRTDGLSYAWDADGIVVSSDLMLVGVSGYYGAMPPTNSWLRIPGPTAALPAAPTLVAGTQLKGNSIDIPTGFNIRELNSVFTSLPFDGSDTFAFTQNISRVVSPVLDVEFLTVKRRRFATIVEPDYPLFIATETLDVKRSRTPELILANEDSLLTSETLLIARGRSIILAEGAIVIETERLDGIRGKSSSISHGFEVPSVNSVFAFLQPTLSVTVSNESLGPFTATATITLANAAIGLGTINLPKVCKLSSISCSQAAWFRLYNSSAARTNDTSRPRGTSWATAATLGSGVICDDIFTGAEVIQYEPILHPINRENPATTSYPFRLVNDGPTGTITIALTYYPG